MLKNRALKKLSKEKEQGAKRWIIEGDENGTDKAIYQTKKPIYKMRLSYHI